MDHMDTSCWRRDLLLEVYRANYGMFSVVSEHEYFVAWLSLQVFGKELFGYWKGAI